MEQQNALDEKEEASILEDSEEEDEAEHENMDILDDDADVGYRNASYWANING